MINCGKNQFLVARLPVSVAAALVLSGCVSVNIDKNLANTTEALATFSDAELILKRSNEDREHADAIVDAGLAETLNQSQAVQIALANSANFQALLANSWAGSVQAAQSGRIPNPILSLEDISIGPERELTQLLSIGLLDVIRLPARQKAARSRVEFAQLQLTGDVVKHITDVRQAWVRAISTQQRLTVAQQLFESAEASAELALLMEQAGNFNRLDRARQQSFYIDAATQLSAANHSALAAREALIRILGLNEEQSARLSLPTELPQVPEEPLSTEDVSRVALNDRIDVQMAGAALNAASRAQGLGNIFSFTDIEGGIEFEQIREDGETESGVGYELEIVLPVFDYVLKRDSLNATTLAASNTLEATFLDAASNLRESYSAYRTAHATAVFFDEEIMPLQEIIVEENTWRYNGMIIGVFDLLADSRRQTAGLISAVDAHEQFWLADAAIQASIIGQPTSLNTGGAVTGMAGGDEEH